ncbi:MAG: hypothetical protein HKN30_06445, partial [Sulfitobacter sp.]|nr:hypothetical protein [Sulfitobacter sp.]
MTSGQIVFLGFVLTALFVIFCAVIGVMDNCETIGDVEDCRSNFGRFLLSPPNEKGDTLAGIAGSLAFLWIIITVLLQGKELALQREEIEKMRLTQEKQTGLLLKQSSQMDQYRVDEKIEKLVSHLNDTLPLMKFAHWEIGKDKEDAKRVAFVGNGWDVPKDHTTVVWFRNAINNATRAVLAGCNEEVRVLSPRLPPSWKEAQKTAAEIASLFEEASPKQQTWLDKT